MDARRSSVQARNAARSPLGRIRLAGFAAHSEGMRPDPPRVLGSYALAYVLDGRGRYQDANGLDCRIRAGDLLVVFPELPHIYGPIPPERWTEFYLMFDGPIFDLWRSTGLLDARQPVYHLEPIEYWAHRLESVLGAPRQPGHAPPLQEICRLQLVLSDALLAQEGQLAGDEAAWVDRASALLDADVDREVDLHDLARELGMSYDGFRKRFARAAGMPPAKYRGARAVDRACELMQGGNLTDRQIAERLGFCDEFYFSRRFKQLTGRSPRQFRAELPRTR